MSVRRSWQPIYDKEGKCIGRREFFFGSRIGDRDNSSVDSGGDTCHPWISELKEIGIYVAIFCCMISVLVVLMLIGDGWKWILRKDLVFEFWLAVICFTLVVSLVVGRHLVWRGIVSFVRFFRCSVRRLEEESRP